MALQNQRIGRELCFMCAIGVASCAAQVDPGTNESAVHEATTYVDPQSGISYATIRIATYLVNFYPRAFVPRTKSLETFQHSV